MNNFRKWGWRLAVPAALVALPVLSFAAVNLPTGTELTLNKIEAIIGTVANWLIGIGVVIAVIFIIWGGISWMAARGDPTKVTKARDAIKNGLIGAVIVLGVGVILWTLRAVVTRTFFGAGQ
ncbi:MAG: pilin [Patescibacteria group bacterium]